MRISDWSSDVCSSDLYSVLPGDDVDRGLQASRQQRAAPLFAQRFGATVGSEFIGRKKLGQSMLRLTYIERTQKQPLPWAFYFYLTSNGWVLSEFGWSAQPAPQIGRASCRERGCQYV